jgi:uncharacterized protein (DUF58 family)
MRRLEVTAAGRWFLAFTIIMGVTALGSSNNVLYLLEALLLGSLLVSGILSERIIYQLSVEFIRRPATAGEPVSDRIRVRNTGRFAHYCVEVGEWRQGRFYPVAFIPVIAPREERVIAASLTLPARGIHRWDGVAVATAFPFGFARKVYVMKEPGERLVWPRRERRDAERDMHESGSKNRAGHQFAEGEVRPMTHEDDARGVVWTLSAKGSQWMVRSRRAEDRSPELALDLRCEAGEEFEKKIVRAASPFFVTHTEQDSSTLLLIESSGRRKIIGRKRVLDTLATIRAEGRAEGKAS